MLAEYLKDTRKSVSTGLVVKFKIVSQEVSKAWCFALPL
jgi:hypothetical protein